MDLHQGDCIQLSLQSDLAAGPGPVSQHGGGAHNAPRTFQVIGVDAGQDRCWLRSWPLARQGSPVFEMSLAQVHRQGQRCPRAPRCPQPLRCS